MGLARVYFNGLNLEQMSLFFDKNPLGSVFTFLNQDEENNKINQALTCCNEVDSVFKALDKDWKQP
jgi:hypothetical protein